MLIMIVPYLEKSNHGLETADHRKVDSILEWRHGDQGASSQAFPVCENAILLTGCHIARRDS